jgi:hypothetical protein
VIDFDTDTVLLEKAADERMAPSSMSKLMTLYLVFQRLKEGKLQLAQELPVTARARNMGGERRRVEDRRLLHEVIVIVGDLPSASWEHIQRSRVLGGLRIDLDLLHRRQARGVHPRPNHQRPRHERQNRRYETE